MLAKFTGFTLIGLDGEIVEVEVDTNNGLPSTRRLKNLKKE